MRGERLLVMLAENARAAGSRPHRNASVVVAAPAPQL